MRAIKFRGFNKKNKEWLYGFYLQNRGCHFVSPDEWAGDKTWDDYEVEKSTIGQFTGLFDKNDKEIWEDDVVRCGSFVYEVKYDDKRTASFYLRRDGDMYRHYFGEAMESYECEVIGNVYDNPALIKEAEK